MNIRVFPWLLFLAISGPLILGMKNNNPDEHQKFESGESSSHGQNMTKLAGKIIYIGFKKLNLF